MKDPAKPLLQVVALLALALSSGGCAALDRVEGALASTGAFDFGPTSATVARNDGAVSVLGAGGEGRGAIVGPRSLLTVKHVVGDATSVDVGLGYLWATARVVREIPSWPEPLVELELEADDAVDADRVLARRPGRPEWVLCKDGPRAWGQALRPGDSGSPVVDASGAVVGLAVGNLDRQPVLASAREPSGAEVARLR